MGANRWKTATRVAAAPDPVDHLLPVRGGRHVRPQGRAGPGAAARGATCGRLHLRPGLSGPERGRPLLLRRPVRTAGAVRPDHRRAAVRCPDLQHRAADRGHRGDRPATVTLWASSSAPDTDFTAKLEVVQPRRRGDQSQRRHHPHLVPGLAVPSDSDHARSAVPLPNLRVANELRVPRRRPHPGGDLQQRLPAVRPEPEHRCAVRSETPSRGRRRRRSCTTRRIRRRSRCR